MGSSRKRSSVRLGEGAPVDGLAGGDAPSEGPLELCVAVVARLATHPLPPAGSVSIGRSEENDVRIDDPSVSRRHARIHVGPPLRIEDLGSANGVRLRRPVSEPRTAQLAPAEAAPGQTIPLQIGDGISLGSAVLMVRRASAPASPSGFVVRDEAMRKLHELAARVAPGAISVLLLGETGVGKEVLAEIVHRSSPRRAAPFLRLNCAALSEPLLESELFGHERGAFTGAVQAKAGLLETADGGTVLLDEVGELAPAIQAKLLRVIEERTVTRVGGLSARPVDVRLISATNRDLEAEVRRGTFRQDLFFRLNGIALTIPPLRRRPSEIEPLARMFAARAAAQIGRPAPLVTPAALAALARHAWPGNVRELKNAMERAVILSETGEIGPEQVALSTSSAAILIEEPPAQPAVPAAPEGSRGADLRSELAALERQRIVDALETCAGNQTKAAAALGISRRTLIVRLEAYRIPRPRKR